MSQAGPRGWGLAVVLTGHVLLGFVWLVVYLTAVFLTSSETGAVDLVLVLGGLCWLVALPVIVMRWQSGSRRYWAVPAAWIVVFGIAGFVVVWRAVGEATS